MGKLGCTPTTRQSHSCVCDPNQINALASTNQCTENIPLLPTATTNIHASPAPTHSRVSFVSLPRASILPLNLLRCGYLNVGCAQHGQTCVHTNNLRVTSLCLRPEPNECTRSNQPMHRERSVASYVYAQHTHKPCSDSQPCQLGEVAEGLDTCRELVAIPVPECGLCVT